MNTALLNGGIFVVMSSMNTIAEYFNRAFKAANRGVSNLWNGLWNGLMEWTGGMD